MKQRTQRKKGRESAGVAGSATQTMLPSLHLTSSSTGDNNGISKPIPSLNIARFLFGLFQCALTIKGRFYCFFAVFWLSFFFVCPASKNSCKYKPLKFKKRLLLFSFVSSFNSFWSLNTFLCNTMINWVNAQTSFQMTIEIFYVKKLLQSNVTPWERLCPLASNKRS